jgi:AraC-like DNA-binding protein
MKKDILHEPFELVLKEFLDICPRGEHAHSFFEIIYVVAGTGVQAINSAEFAYKPGHMFVIAPDDSHRFDIKTPTQFFFIRFNDSYIQAKEPGPMQRIEAILNNAGQEPGCVLKSDADKPVAKALMAALIEEHNKKGLYHKELINQYISTLLVIISRNLMMSFPSAINEHSDNKAVKILHYVQANIYSPNLLKGENISQKFGISEAYIGRYFRKHMNETLQQYIMNYRLKLIDNRLQHTNMQVNEIANEFGFTDKSHLNRIYKKHKGLNPTAFRQQWR